MIETERLRLRELTLEDADALQPLMEAPAGFRPPITQVKARIRNWSRRSMDGDALHGVRMLAVVLKETGEMIGLCGIVLKEGDGEAVPEIGCSILRPYRGQGYATEAARAVRDWTFRNTDRDRILSRIRERNSSAISVAFALGMKWVRDETDRGMATTCVYAITREEWEQRGQLAVFFGETEDLGRWMQLVREVRWILPGLETEKALDEHEQTVLKFMRKRQALCVKKDGEVAGVLLFSRNRNMICCLAVSKDYRRQGIASMLMEKALGELDRSRDITVSTFRAGDDKGIAPRALYRKLGFEEGELTVEFGYPNQVFVLHGTGKTGDGNT